MYNLKYSTYHEVNLHVALIKKHESLQCKETFSAYEI